MAISQGPFPRVRLKFRAGIPGRDGETSPETLEARAFVAEKAIEVGEDAQQVAADRIVVEAAAIQTAGDRVQTGVDRAATVADRAAAEAARDNAVATAYGAVLLSVTALKALPIPISGTVVRVIGRQGGFFKFQSGNLAAEVASDPSGGLWVAPNLSPTGSAGAWQRIVEKSIYDAEWWLPDVMPANAQIALNAGILAIPGNVGKFLMPRRETTITGSLRFSKGLTYEGFGRVAPVNGGGGNLICIFVMADNSRLINISSGNVQGQLVYSEAAGFIVHDGAPLWQSTRKVENVSFVDCHTFDAETGLSAPPGAMNHTTGGSPSFSHDVEVFGPRDVYIENFQCNGIERIGIELMRTNGATVIGGKVEMKVPDPVTGFDRGVRIAGAHNVHLNGLHIVSPNSTSVYGVSVEGASQGGGAPYKYTYGGSSNITVEACTMEDCPVGGAVTNAFCRKVNFLNNRIIGRREAYGSSGFAIAGDRQMNGGSLIFPQDEVPQLDVKIIGNSAINVSNFIRLAGYQYGTQIKENYFISNTSTAAVYSQSFVYASTANNRYIELEIVGNKGYTPSSSPNRPVNLQNLETQSLVTIDDNAFTPSSGGVIYNITGDATIRMKSSTSNRTLSTGLWEQLRPPLDQEDYPVGDADFIQGIY